MPKFNVKGSYVCDECETSGYCVNNGCISEHQTFSEQSQNPDKFQIGGDHYKNMGTAPWNVIDTWPIEQRIGAYRSAALKYLMRMGTKHEDSVEEIRKSIHYLNKLVQTLEEGEELKHEQGSW